MTQSMERVGRAEGLTTGLPIETPEVQAALMLAAFRDSHHEPSVDPVHWDRNDEAMQTAAMGEWVGDPNDPDSPAAHFRAYAEEHPQERINIEDEASLEKLLAEIKRKQLH